MNYIKNYIAKPTIKDFYVPSFCRGCWIFDNNTNKIIDYSQYQNHGTNNGSINNGNANFFNGTSDYINLINSTSVDIISAPLSIFATLKIDNSASTGYIICKNVDSSTNIQYAVAWNSTNKAIDVPMQGSTVRVSTLANSVLTDKTYDVGFIWNGNNIKAYVNGVQSGTTNLYTATLTSRANLRIGRRETAAAHIKGYINNVCIYASADETEILRHRKIISKNLI